MRMCSAVTGRLRGRLGSPRIRSSVFQWSAGRTFGIQWAMPADRSLCAGRLGLGPNDPNCADRTRCQRYIELLATHGDAIPVEIWVASKMRESNEVPCEQFRGLK